jgi:hypothetical protein
MQCRLVSSHPMVIIYWSRVLANLYLPLTDRGQGLNHCICDVSHFLETIHGVQNGETGLKNAVGTYEEEMIPRGHKEVSCSIENGYMFHDWNKVKESPVFTRGFKPMEGHDGKDTFSEHAKLQLKREEQEGSIAVGSVRVA